LEDRAKLKSFNWWPKVCYHWSSFLVFF